ncbi:hypothetical protein HRR86_006758 [Exophiala dermatitidis]|nr:hypothetical protein HRR77_004236 [Exophiala dermatitidis]KAJ4575662.1 hypothetical protein HRR79_002568 [Exophiala dermatitidis]KAJ4620051.1 hypothetical protein HRR86_006758 [Exophiala dermatitidis]KAJ4680143.1 hypothetical protein HRR95_003862 [Exophiala dermatitidis]
MASGGEREGEEMMTREKRPWSPESPSRSQDGRHHANLTSGIAQNTTYIDEFSSKRPRLAAMTPNRSIAAQAATSLRRARPQLQDLPAEILQHIFSFVDPVSLGRLIRVNRSFRSLLDPTVPLPQPSGQAKRLRLRSQNLIWTISRNTYIQGFPRPVDGMTELDTWRLALSQVCQYCGAKVRGQDLSPPEPSPWRCGPGLEGVCPIWPFHEIDLLVSSSSALSPGLPFAIFTADLHYVPSIFLRNTSPPLGVQLTKFFFKPQLEELERERDDIQGFGTAVLEEWYKGLEARGREQNAIAARFELWAVQGGFRKPFAVARRGLSKIELPGGMSVDQEESAFQRQHVRQDKFSSLFAGDRPGSASKGDGILHGILSADLRAVNVGPSEAWHGDAHSSVDIEITPTADPVRHIPRQRVERSLKEAEQAKAERRKEIERRCMALNPPIMPSTLNYMDAFKAAIMISQPLNKRAWETLKPRLLAQRLEAEHKEMVPFGARLEEHHDSQANKRLESELKVASRDKIRKYAQEFIHQTWSDGRGVTKATASKFAAEVLCHVRQRFAEVIAREDRMLAMKGTAFPQDAESQACRILRLEDMKWAFEEFVKPHTERFGKDIFLCRVCDTNQKLFSFEAVIQHYAAKHTSALSNGNTVVYWKALWPVDPPFDPSPNIPWVQEGLHIGGQNTTPSSHGLPTYPDAAAYRAQEEDVAAGAHEFWQRLHGIWDLPDPVRLYVVIQHISSRFLKKFHHELSFSLFREAVTRHPELHFLRELSLRCKICFEAVTAVPESVTAHDAGRYSLPELLTHFQLAHFDSDEARRQTQTSLRLDWKREMIALPSRAAIQALRHSPGINQNKLQVISEAFPDYFPASMPYVGALLPLLDPTRPSLVSEDSFFSKHNEPVKGRGAIRKFGAGSHVTSSEGSAIAAEDEYDPHRPALIFRQPYPPDPRHGIKFIPRGDERPRVLSSYYQEPPASREYYYREVDRGSSWDVHSRDGPLSGGSMVYSHDEESSRFSYVEPYNRNSDTTLDGVVVGRPGSRDVGRWPAPLGADTGSPRARPVSKIRADSDDLESRAAAEFLDSFNAVAIDYSAGPDVHVPAARPRRNEQTRSDLAHLQPTVLYSQDARHPFRPGSRVSEHRSPPYQGHIQSLPMRQGGRDTADDDHYRSHSATRSGLLGQEPLRTPQVTMVAGGEHRSILPERPERSQVERTTNVMRDREVTANPRYEPRYYPVESDFLLDGRRYEMVGDIPAETYARPLDTTTREYEQHRNLQGQGYGREVEERYWYQEPSHADYLRRGPRYYVDARHEHMPQAPLETDDEFAGYDDRYAIEDRQVPRRRIRATAADDHPELTYDPFAQPRPYAPR